MQDAQEAYRKLSEHLEQDKQAGNPDQEVSGTQKFSFIVPGQKKESAENG